MWMPPSIPPRRGSSSPGRDAADTRWRFWESDARSDSIRCVVRTTLNLDPSVLEELKSLQRRKGKTLGDLASELLAQALAGHHPGGEGPPLRWKSGNLGLKVDLEDKEVVWAALEGR